MALPDVLAETDANRAIQAYEGEVTFSCDTTTLTGQGTLSLEWAPDSGVVVNVRVNDFLWAPSDSMEMRAGPFSGNALIVHSAPSMSAEEGSWTTLRGWLSTASTEPPAEIYALRFQLANFLDFLNPGHDHQPTEPSLRRLRLRFGEWTVDLESGSRDLFKSLDESGGYGLTHIGQLTRTDEKPFAVSVGQHAMKVLTDLLTFAQGDSCGAPVRWGLGEHGETTWQHYGSSVLGRWKRRAGWLDEHHASILGDLAPAFAQTHQNTETGESLLAAIHWYRECNLRAGGMEGALVFGLMALDLLGAMILVEQTGAMTDKRYDALRAADKLDGLAAVLGVQPQVPARCGALRAFAVQAGWNTSGTALAELRHGFVHPNKVRRTAVFASAKEVRFEAWQVTLWLVEIALLRLFGYQGVYRNRLTAKSVGAVEPVPWSTPR